MVSCISNVNVEAECSRAVGGAVALHEAGF